MFTSTYCAPSSTAGARGRGDPAGGPVSRWGKGVVNTLVAPTAGEERGGEGSGDQRSAGVSGEGSEPPGGARERLWGGWGPPS